MPAEPKSLPPENYGTVLVIEDVYMVRRTLELMLRSGGYQVIEAAEPGAALTAIRKAKGKKIDLILLDIMMPGTDGLHFCRSLKSTDATRNTPVIMCTAHSDAQTVTEAKKAGATDFIAKPFSRDVVLEKVDRVLGVQRAKKTPAAPNEGKAREVKGGKKPEGPSPATAGPKPH